MAKNTWKTALEAIEKYDNIFIFHHIRPDGDCLGSQFGLRELIKTNYPKKHVFVFGDNVGLFPFLEWEFDKFEEVDKKYFKNSLGVVVDANSSNRIQFVNLILDKNFTHMLRIDHHPVDPDINYDYTWEDATYAAAGEQIAYIAMKSNWEVTTKAAKYLYLAINTDSGRFMFDYVQKRTFDVVSYLHKNNDFHVWDVNFPLSIREEKKVRFNAYVMLNYKNEGKVLYFHATNKIQKKFKLTPIEASDVGILANIGDCKIWVLFIDQPDGTIRARVRSNEIWINHICAKYKPGGGHEVAAGATCYSKKEMFNLIEDLKSEVIKHV
ncbi:bifunctional oligoribonuclease/PAP phosphatase NrnA [Metamycoplasma equirhinis]|uniref:Bifunctional oligoribonuclease/PAP phosphatase NrnA n=1 Tax=Metamycoplasma equirhinis TaxID=92402 RepID=A0ABZ0PAJ4_9BACT|nr:bifunctional oligoribonuclease/PAP phosphatase NrnA [Metamycoplasma equirhinis]TPD98886.1 bifunctional oligoribonuclease/PAP phosphatase NrnA [Metamycoplasma equirhinis]WPB54053.1 bifunctional oligoribonuclease/PAP phosphatase NrnA [Metamycoplasma equirhinis]